MQEYTDLSSLLFLGFTSVNGKEKVVLSLSVLTSEGTVNI